ncbi:hypothetical protein BDK92_1240 [Micromonospora pisi]|uniref:DUF4878 domain-containing protein n=1 Tax=Micromonospora pisi TaxID=589240 RepID=A0A495JEL3_9ACTN|nr:hypothetical protein [Micromonospora pisi]RKR86968.1 hypothetical protein BDK92_1240 [Micromonospora pisi]
MAPRARTRSRSDSVAAAASPWTNREVRRPLLAVAALTLALLLGGLGIGGFFLFRPGQEPETAARIAIDSFVQRLIAGNYGGAYDQLCSDTRERLDREQFTADIGGRPAVRSYQIDKIERSGRTFSISVTLADPSGASEAHVYRVVEDRGSWRICGDPIPA